MRQNQAQLSAAFETLSGYYSGKLFPEWKYFFSDHLGLTVTFFNKLKSFKIYNRSSKPNVFQSGTIGHLHYDAMHAMASGSCSKEDENDALKLKQQQQWLLLKHVTRKKINLTENDVPGASFKDKEPELFHNDKLRRWLKCQGSSTRGNQSQLLQR